jgi:hypothetical protein
MLLFLLGSRQRSPLSPVSNDEQTFVARRLIDMERVNSLLRSTSSRIRRRLALIVEIAAASLPSAGV